MKYIGVENFIGEVAEFEGKYYKVIGQDRCGWYLEYIADKDYRRVLVDGKEECGLMIDGKEECGLIVGVEKYVLIKPNQNTECIKLISRQDFLDDNNFYEMLDKKNYTNRDVAIPAKRVVGSEIF